MCHWGCFFGWLSCGVYWGGVVAGWFCGYVFEDDGFVVDFFDVGVGGLDVFDVGD